MKKTAILKILNPILLVFFVNQAVSVLFRDYYSLRAFRFFHMTGGAILLCLIALHFILNFNWVKANYFAK
ncbi:MAG: hypothetical protein NTW93_03865 [Phycisphaerae bacterium]|nr:hypothetical protein [Phycisphaerae bacterium]